MITGKKVRHAVSFVLDAIGYIGSILWILILLGLAPEPLHGVEFLSEYFAIFVFFALLILFLSALWLGYQIHAWRTHAVTFEKWIPPIDSRFRHLMFHFSRSTDTPTGTHEKPNYVVNHHTKYAYPIPSMLELYLKNVAVYYESHANEVELKKYFRTNEIKINPKDPEPEDLDLVRGWDGSLQLPDLNWIRLFDKLNGRKIKGVTIIRFYPWYRYLLSKPPYTPNRLLIKSQEAFWAPFHDYDLIANHQIDCGESTKLPYRLWCWLHHYHYHQERAR